MTNIVKCTQCNLIVNELLSYVQNKVSVIDEDTLVRVCTSAFEASEIKIAKSLLFEAIPTDKRKIIRKNAGKEKRDLTDIINLFKSTDPDIIPIFVAKDLDKLPPVTFDHLDCTKLLKDMVIMKSEIDSIKSSYVTHDDINDLKREICRLGSDSLPPTSAFKVNTKRSAWLDSGPMGLSHDCHTLTFDEFQIEDRHKDITKSPSPLTYRDVRVDVYEHEPTAAAPTSSEPQQSVTTEQACAGGSKGRDARGERLSATLHHEPRAGSDSSASGEAAAVTSPQSPAQSVPQILALANKARHIPADGWRERQKSQMSPVISNEGWQYVQRKKPSKYRFVGKSGVARDLQCNFKAADKKIPIFITNVHLDTKECDIIDYIRNKTNEVVDLEKINMKTQRGHKAYKFLTSECNVSLFLDERLWPTGIIFRRFVHFKNKRSNSPRAVAGLSKVRNE